jgi:dTDP-4-amino-4,6-dideoxygalactose transaminase
MLVDQPQAFIDGLREKGFDCANLPRSQAVSPPEDRPQLEPKLAAQALSDLVVVPCYPGMPDSEIQREAEAIREIAGRVGSVRTRAYSALAVPEAVDAA